MSYRAKLDLSNYFSFFNILKIINDHEGNESKHTKKYEELKSLLSKTNLTDGDEKRIDELSEEILDKIFYSYIKVEFNNECMEMSALDFSRIALWNATFYEKIDIKEECVYYFTISDIKKILKVINLNKKETKDQTSSKDLELLFMLITP